MATSSSKQASEILDSTWEIQSPGDRLRTIKQLGADANATQEALSYIARHDEHESVRRGAVKFIQDLDVLFELQSVQGVMQESAAQQYYRILAGNFEAGISQQQRVASISTLPAAALKQVALLAKCKVAGTEALSRIDQAVELADLSLFAVSVHVRKNAALKIQDSRLLAEIRDKVRDKDKTVFKVIEQRLSAILDSRKEEEHSAQRVATTSTKAAPTTLSVASEAKAEAKAEVKAAVKPVKQPPLNPEKELPKLEQELSKLSYKNTAHLNALHHSLNNLSKVIAASNTDLAPRANTLHEVLTEKLKKNNAHQDQLRKNTEALLDTLKQALEEGQSHDALPAWDKIQGNISNTSGKLRASLQKQANLHKNTLNELRDWKIYAATEKKKDLVKQMQHLIESKMHAADRSRHIGNMHRDWKALGRSNQNEALWREFKKLSDEAYAPCKDYFKQRKLLMASNLEQRRELCDKLESDLTNIDKENVNIAKLNKLLSGSEQDWKRYAPVEQSKIRNLQKRYYLVVNKLRKLRKVSLRENGKLKQDYISQAQALCELEDNQQAMNNARSLQQQWKKVGPTSYKEDNKYWEEFRAACDKIFEKRNQEAENFRESLKQIEKNIAKILQSLESLFNLDDDAFRKSRVDFQDLMQEFSSSLDPRIKKQRTRLLDKFNGLKRNIEMRFKNLPDKKRQLLKNALLAKSKFLEKIESKLLASKDEKQFVEIKDQLDNGAWEQIESSGNAQYEEALQDRLQNTVNAGSLDALRSLAQECEAKVRSLCIELEIRANIDTPKHDQALRMQIQLNQLKHGFGQSKPDRNDNTKYAMDAELKSFCLGPLATPIQQELTQRLQGAIRKLL